MSLFGRLFKRRKAQPSQEQSADTATSSSQDLFIIPPKLMAQLSLVLQTKVEDYLLFVEEHPEISDDVVQEMIKISTAPYVTPVEAVQDFILNGTLEKKKMVVEARQRKLLTDEAEHILDALLQHVQDDAAATRVFQQHKTLLINCRRKGINAAFAETPYFQTQPDDSTPHSGNDLNPEIYALKEKIESLTLPHEMPLRARLCQQALDLLDRENQSMVWAQVQGMLADSLFRNPDGDQAENIEQAIHHYQLALEVLSRETLPAPWAFFHKNLAVAYRNRRHGEPEENIEQAIGHYQSALLVYTQEDSPKEWGETQHNLANAYISRIQGETTENLDQAIHHYQLALQVRPREAFPEKWANTQNSLATAYLELHNQGRAGCVEQAIGHLHQALEVYTLQQAPERWVMIQTNLATAYSKRVQGERADNLEHMLQHCQAALEVCTKEHSPEHWNILQSNLRREYLPVYLDYIQNKQSEDLEKSRMLYQRALQVYTRQEFPDLWAMTQVELSRVYYERTEGDSEENLEQAIEHCTLALEVYSRDHAFPGMWTRCHHELATLYAARIRGTHAENLERAIEHGTLALEVDVRQTEPEWWAKVHNTLGALYSRRVNGERTENQRHAIEHYHKALEVYTFEDFPEHWGISHANLGAIYKEYPGENRAENMDQAIEHFTHALKTERRDIAPEQWADIHCSLASLYSERVHGKRIENLEQAIVHCESALKVYTRQDFLEKWALLQGLLSNIYWSRLAGRRVDNLEKAIEHGELVQDLYSRQATPEIWASIKIALANAYGDRIRGDRAENLELAIEHTYAALEVFTREDFPDMWAKAHNNLGELYRDRIDGVRLTNYEDALGHEKLTLEVYNREDFPEEWALTQKNLARTYILRIRGDRENNLIDRSDNLEQAIKHAESALSVYTRQNYPEPWASTQSTLAVAYSERICGDRGENLEHALKHHNLALEIYTPEMFPQDWATAQLYIGSAYRDHPAENRKEEYLEKAIRHYQLAMQVFTCKASPLQHAAIQSYIGDIYFEKQLWKEAYAAFDRAIEAGKLQFTEAYSEIGRMFGVKMTSQLYVRAAYSLLRLDRFGEALYTLEQGKARLLAETLALNEIDLTLLPPEQQTALRNAQEIIRSLEEEMRAPTRLQKSFEHGVLQLRADLAKKTDEDTLTELESWMREHLYSTIQRNPRETAELLRQARNDLNQLTANIRQKYPDFMTTSLNLEAILQCIPRDGALVAPLATSQGGVVFVLPSGAASLGPEHIVWFDSFTDAELNALISGSPGKPGWLSVYRTWRKDKEHRAWETAMESFTGQMWELLMKAVHERLKSLGVNEGAPILLMPQGGLGLLPLHAAWREIDGKKRAFLDDYQVTYTPSAYTLNVSQSRLSDPDRHQRLFLAVINPTKDLEYASVEGEVVTALFDQKNTQCLSEDEATVDAVMHATADSNYLHFSCHGLYNWHEEVMQSGLLLAGKELLTLSDIIGKLDFGRARLVSLSACETGLTDYQQAPDEYIGLPAGFLQAGAPGVISTLWAVNDLSTMLLMEKFYIEHIDGMSPTAALRKAQLWLRDVTADELTARFDAERERQKSNDEGSISYQHAAAAWRRFASLAPEDRPFAHPYYWAAFTFTGV